MRKRIVSVLLCLCMVLCMMPTVSLAADDDTSASENITWTLSADGTLTISGTGEMQTGLNNTPWNDNKDEIEKVVIENGVENIGDWAFNGCTNLKSVTISDSVTSIGTGAFNLCTNLLSVKIPDKVTEIKNVAFSACSSLVRVTLPESLQSIGEGAFSNCSALGNVTIPKNVTEIGESVFDSCTSLTAINVNAANESYYSSNGALISKTTGELMKFPQAKKGSYTIPNDVKSIADRAFYNSPQLTAVTIPDSVTSIGDSAFGLCSALGSVTIPGSVTKIANNAFTQCGSLTDVILSDGVKNIGEYAFFSCGKLEKVTLPNSVTSIGGGAFSSCTSLENITIPDSVTSVAGSVLNETAYYNTESNWKDNVLYCGNWIITATSTAGDVKIIDGTLGIADNAFNYSDVSSVEMPDSLRTIGDSAFLSCDNLKNLEIPASVKIIGEYGFGYEYVIDWDTLDMDYQLVSDFAANVHEGSAAEAYCTQNKIECVVEKHTEVTDAAVEPNCGTAGKTEGSHCETCGAIIKAQEEIAATGEHTWDSGKVTKEATCTATGVTTYTCTVCGETKTEDIAKIAHTPVTDAAVAPTCTTAGKTEGSHCSVCDEVIEAQKEIAATGHSFTNYVYNNDAKPGVDGTETATCDNGCNTTDTRTKAGTAKPTITFTDVDANAYYAAPVQWAVEREITNGMGDGKFEPNTTCTRGQIVTFLWRAKGSPEPTSTNNPFSDVNINEYYGKAVLWAVEQGITTGTSATTFSPNQGCTRGQVATFLWRAEGKPSSTVGNQFSDVNTSEYYGTAVLWASEKGITNGMGDGTFAPNATCTRGQIVTFLYRAMA